MIDGGHSGRGQREARVRGASCRVTLDVRVVPSDVPFGVGRWKGSATNPNHLHPPTHAQKRKLKVTVFFWMKLDRNLPSHLSLVDQKPQRTARCRRKSRAQPRRAVPR